jgi:hypothetical protein
MRKVPLKSDPKKACKEGQLKIDNVTDFQNKQETLKRLKSPKIGGANVKTTYLVAIFHAKTS